MKIITTYLNTFCLLLVLALLAYVIFVILPDYQEKQKYLFVMQACNERQLYMTREITEAFNKLGETATQEEIFGMNNTLTSTTNYFHTPGYYQECYTRTLEEWSLSD